MSLKYLSNIWRSLEITLINYKIELKLKWIKSCVLSAAGTDNIDANPNNIIFTIKDTKLYVPVVILSAKDNQKLSKLLSIGLERSIYWNEYKTKNENRNITNEYRYFLEWNLVGVNRLLVLVYSNQDNNAKRFKTRRYYLPKGVISNYKVITNGKNLYDQPIDSEKLTTRQGKDYTIGRLLDYNYIKNYYKLIAIYLGRQKELDADPKTIQQ